MKRRKFLVRGATGLAGATAWGRLSAGLGSASARPNNSTVGLGDLARRSGSQADLVIRNGTIFDGTGGPPRSGDVAIAGDRILALGSVPAGRTPEIDARGMAVVPGFIDIHSHADLSLLVNPLAESRVRQGVTLEVVGQDGSSVGPWGDAVFESTRDRYRRSYGVEIDFRDLGGFLDRIDRERPAVSVATMAGHGTIRGRVVGGDGRPASPAEMERMRALLREALSQGAVGLSSGLEYIPSSFAGAEELASLAGELRGTPYPYASHIRNEDDRLLAALEEALHVGRTAGVPVQVSHLKAQGERNYWKADAALAVVEAARRDGVDVHFDRYPYAAYATGLSSLFPAWGRAGGSARLMERLEDPADGPVLERACRDKVALLGSWDAVQVSRTGGADARAKGRRLGELAQELGEEPYALMVRLLREAGGNVGMIGFGMSEENTERILSHPLGMLCSDGGAYAPYGPLSRSTPHPRGYGSFPRLLGHYVRERRAMPLETAIRKATGLPAAKLGLADRGVLAVGSVADVVVFDPDQVADRASFEEPHQYPTGIHHVIAHGVHTIRDGEQTGERGGRAVRGVRHAHRTQGGSGP